MNRSKQAQESDKPQMDEHAAVQRLNNQEEQCISNGDQSGIADEMPEKVDDHNEKQWCYLRKDESSSVRACRQRTIAYPKMVKEIKGYFNPQAIVGHQIDDLS